jgi:hypothetical protein
MGKAEISILTSVTHIKNGYLKRFVEDTIASRTLKPSLQ